MLPGLSDEALSYVCVRVLYDDEGEGWATPTIVATPVFGGHYGVDVIMGLVLAPPALFAARHLTRQRQSFHRVDPALPA